MRRVVGACVAAAFVVLALASCKTVEIDTPAGFAQFTDEVEPRAVSPEGVALRVRTTENRPVQDLEFWSSALERHMIESGYLQLDTGTFRSGDLDGVFFEWLAPVNDQDWVYLTGIAVAGDVIVIAEAAGPYEYYESHRDAMIDALSTVTVVR